MAQPKLDILIERPPDEALAILHAMLRANLVSMRWIADFLNKNTRYKIAHKELPARFCVSRDGKLKVKWT
jgi:hypothetical protein